MFDSKTDIILGILYRLFDGFLENQFLENQFLFQLLFCENLGCNLIFNSYSLVYIFYKDYKDVI